MPRAQAVATALILLAALAGCGREDPPSGEGGAGSAAEELERQCTGGNLEACRTLGLRYQLGDGVAADPPRAVALFERACGGNLLSACNNLGLVLAEGMGTARDPARAAQVYQKACDGKYALACRNLGLMLRDGYGVPADLARADALLDQACTAGAPFACTNAGNLDATLVEKEGAPRRKRMLGHFTRGCDRGDPTSCRQLGVLYLEGFGLPRSAGAASVWLKKACDGDDAIACRLLGLLHRDGAGVDRDPARSEVLLRRACGRRDEEACKLIGARADGPGSASQAPSGAGSGRRE